MGVGPYPTLDNVSGKNINAGKVLLLLFRKLLLLTLGDHISHLHNLSQSSEAATSI